MWTRGQRMRKAEGDHLRIRKTERNSMIHLDFTYKKTLSQGYKSANKSVKFCGLSVDVQMKEHRRCCSFS